MNKQFTDPTFTEPTFGHGGLVLVLARHRDCWLDQVHSEVANPDPNSDRFMVIWIWLVSLLLLVCHHCNHGELVKTSIARQ